MIKLKQISKSFGSFKALDKVSFSLRQGVITAFLGVNGAGKTTTMRIINGILDADSGQVKVDSYDPHKQPLKVRQIVGYLPENNPLYTNLEVVEYLALVAKLHHVSDFPAGQKALFAKMGIDKVWQRHIDELSKGYRQRVGLTAALIHRPKVLILDEPLSGLDPVQKGEIIGLLKQIGKKTTVLFSTHVLAEVKDLCDDVIIINKGKIVYQDHLDSRKGQYLKLLVKFAGTKSKINGLIKAKPQIKLVSLASLKPGLWQADFQILGSKKQQDSLLRFLSAGLADSGIILEFRPESESLSDLFYRLTKNEV